MALFAIHSKSIAVSHGDIYAKRQGGRKWMALTKDAHLDERGLIDRALRELSIRTLAS